MKKSKWIMTVNIVLFVCMMELTITGMLGDVLQGHTFGILHGTAGFIFFIFGIIHIVQHWGWVKVNFAKALLKSGINATNARHHAEAAKAASKAGDWNTARTQWAQALVNAQLVGASPDTLAVYNYEYGRALGVTSFYDESEKYLLRALDLDTQTKGPTYMSLLELSRLQYDQKQYQKSIPYFHRTLESLESSGMAIKAPIDFADMLDEYADALTKAGNEREAIAITSRATRLRAENPNKQSNTDRTPYGTQCIPTPEKEVPKMIKELLKPR